LTYIHAAKKHSPNHRCPVQRNGDAESKLNGFKVAVEEDWGAQTASVFCFAPCVAAVHPSSKKAASSISV
jgi:hypothetical protein